MRPPASRGPRLRGQAQTTKCIIGVFVAIEALASRPTLACQPQTTTMTTPRPPKVKPWMKATGTIYAKQFFENNPGNIELFCYIHKSPSWDAGDEIFWIRKLDSGEYLQVASMSPSNIDAPPFVLDASMYSARVDRNTFASTFAFYRLTLLSRQPATWSYGEYRCGATIATGTNYSYDSATILWTTPTATCWQSTPSKFDDPDSYTLLSCETLGYTLKGNTKIFWVPPTIFGDTLSVPSVRGDFTAFAPRYGVYSLSIRNIDEVKKSNRNYNFTIVETSGQTAVTILSAQIPMGLNRYDIYLPGGGGYYVEGDGNQLLFSAAPSTPRRKSGGCLAALSLLLLLSASMIDPSAFSVSAAL